MAKRIMVVGVPWSTHELVPAARDAERLGARLNVVDTPDALRTIGDDVPCERIAVATLEEPELVAAAHEIAPDCVVSITELTMEHAALVREALGHPGTSADVELTVADKLRTRAVLQKHGLTGVGHWETTLDEVAGLVATLDLPVVVKPRQLTGSAGVRLVADPDDVTPLLEQYDQETAAHFRRDRLLVESYVPGEEISAEGIVVDGELHLFTLTDKVNTGAPHYVEVGHLMPGAKSSEWEPRIHDYLQRCVTALGVVTSPVHAEVKVTDDAVEVIELHTRYGGDDIVQLIERSCGMRPFETYFAAMLDGTRPAPGPHAGDAVWGVGFFSAPVGSAFHWPSYDFPYPQAVMRLEVDATAEPKLRAYEGVRLAYWRAGRALFSAPTHRPVRENIDFLRAQLPRADEQGARRASD
ncbi:ATP-grasp domain-containing protein [Streptomyces spongiae]|uniref:ATP-grasp domain-containing protein n=1 Tax=Streptomyces spongiae TaxID=565072 RepID=A0A5N8XCG5_9ACTN|nr:ATP-grasp domain-containing protein [Streptomyces spongiae]MPY57142.1 ATP-grasp domain-containing protein [Streptomyces spongiae]